MAAILPNPRQANTATADHLRLTDSSLTPSSHILNNKVNGEHLRLDHPAEPQDTVHLPALQPCHL